MNINEQGIRKRIGSDILIGCYTQRTDGSTCFTDIRGGEGDLVNIPSLGEDLEVEYTGKSLEVGVFYSFNWHLSDSGRIVIDGNVLKIDNAKFLAGLFDARLRLSGSNLELFNNFQKTIFNEVTGAQHTYIYELLQNANDCSLCILVPVSIFEMLLVLVPSTKVRRKRIQKPLAIRV